jgi:hypothetical protein
VLVCSERRVLLAGAGGWFVLREKYSWLVADKPSEQGEILCRTVYKLGKLPEDHKQELELERL